MEGTAVSRGTSGFWLSGFWPLICPKGRTNALWFTALGISRCEGGQYKNTAGAFLKGYKKYESRDKAPETLLKLGMSLAALGQKEAACSTFGELNTKFPKAPETVRDEAKAE